ncbi:MAG: hypothetical protein AB1894_28025 [Chloroflexota bacterium]
MNETLISAFYAVSFFFSLFLIGFLWWLAYRYPAGRRLWGWLAAGWSVNTLSSLIWGLYVMLVSEDIPGLVDNLYVLRYVFVLLALWLYPAAWPWRRWAGILAAMLVAALVLWFGFVQPLQKISSQPFDYILAGTIFPLLDAGMLYAAWARWRDTTDQPVNTVMALIALSSLAYGIANWVNYRARAVVPDANPPVALIGWLLTDVFAALAGWWFVRQTQQQIQSSSASSGERP